MQLKQVQETLGKLTEGKSFVSVISIKDGEFIAIFDKFLRASQEILLTKSLGFSISQLTVSVSDLEMFSEIDHLEILKVLAIEALREKNA